MREPGEDADDAGGDDDVVPMDHGGCGDTGRGDHNSDGFGKGGHSDRILRGSLVKQMSISMALATALVLEVLPTTRPLRGFLILIAMAARQR